MIRLFVGYDREQALASAVFAHSVTSRASEPVAVQYLDLRQLRGVFDRPRDPLQSTEFAFSRFLAPYLCDFEGWSLFADGDMICLDDLAALWALRDPAYAVQVVKRESHQITADGRKFLDRPQTAYPRKNWSSVMLFNNARCRALSPGYVATARGLDLHQFAWLDDREIGALPREWNHLVGVDARGGAAGGTAKIVHFTLGMPYFNGLRECEYALEWRQERAALMAYERLDEDLAA
jgi:hypothetical protein